MGNCIAIIITNSEYENLSELPFCKNDGDTIERLLNSSGKFDNILRVHNRTAVECKTKVRSFAKSMHNINVDELFLYFSGHGAYEGDFYFCCKNFDSGNMSTTSFSYTEADEIARALSPAVFVKIIDACNSGKKVLKDTNLFEKLPSSKGLNNVICMASSLDTQSSYGGKTISEFTKAFIRGATNKNTGEVYYRDIQNSVIDYFYGNRFQNPYFVMQATGLETFCNDASLLTSFHNSFEHDQDLPKENKTLTDQLHHALSEREKEYVEVDSAISQMNRVTESAQAEPSDEVVNKYYNFNTSFPELREIPKQSIIAKNISKDKTDLCCEVEYDDEVVMERKRRTGLVATAAMIYGTDDSDDKYEEKVIRSPKYLHSSSEIDILYIFHSATPKINSLAPKGLHIVAIPYRTSARIFWGQEEASRRNWSDFNFLHNDLEWSYENISWSSGVIESVVLEKIFSFHEDLKSNLFSIAGVEFENEERTSDEASDGEVN